MSIRPSPQPDRSRPSIVEPVVAPSSSASPQREWQTTTCRCTPVLRPASPMSETDYTHVTDPAPVLDEQFPIIASPERPVVPFRVLKHGDCFGVFDPRGNIVPGESGEGGLYYDGTRFMSWFELLLFGHPPLLLSSMLGVDDAVFEA